MLEPKKRELGKSFEPQEFEGDLYKFWEESGCFDASDENAPGQDSYCIAIPPPNVTGVLHMGHGLGDTIEDILIRWRRMKGDNTLWIPGTDHAGISTQAQVEKQIAKEGKGPTGRPLTRHDLGREKFLERAWQWKEDHHHIIVGQMRRLGCSLDWKRERFTMDEGFSNAVREVFVRLYEQKLIYRGERIINWCTRCYTALSDLEVIPTDRKGSFWHIRYDIVDDAGNPVKNPDGSNAALVIATTRPETMLGDTALAIHPEDDRYEHLKGKKAKLPLMDRVIPIIEDDYVDREFGSGALKVTPAHDFNDYDLGQRHKLETITVISKEGLITEEGGPYKGLKLKEARKKVVEDLEEQGFLVKTEDHQHKVGLCQRCDQVAEPLISKQWFVKIKPLAEPAIKAVETGEIEFVPKTWEKTYFEWMYNIRDWCISRQLWWGHQIPAWHCKQCEGITVARTDPDACNECKAGKDELERSEDVLDTWFSSGLWPFGTLGWPEKTPALKTFYPNTVMETGFDIIFFWVARMIMMGMHFMGEVPFKKVYLHAMVRDEKGQKMSKSRGNVIDPLEVMDQHGADPLRFTFAVMAGQGRDVKLSTDRVVGYRAFCNKLWNATKYFHMQVADAPIEWPEDLSAWLSERNKSGKLSPINSWILSRFQTTVATVDGGLDRFELDVSSKSIYEFTWHELCDWFIELSKQSLKKEHPDREETLVTLGYVLEGTLRLLHPFTPFVTEELWQSLPFKKPAHPPHFKKDGKPEMMTIMLQAYPEKDKALENAKAEETVKAIQSVVDSVRNFRGENGIAPKTKFPVRFVSKDKSAVALVDEFRDFILSLTQIESLTEETADASEFDAIIPLSHPSMDLRISLKGLVDVDGETKRLGKEIEKTKKDIQHVEKKLSNENFIKRAPDELVAKEKQKRDSIAAKLSELEKALERLKKLG